MRSHHLLLRIFLIALISSYILMTTNANQQTAKAPIPAKQTLSSLESEVQNLESETSQLKRVYGAWNTAYIVLVFIAAGAAVLAGVTQWRSSKAQGEYSDSQVLLGAAKDRLNTAQVEDAKIEARKESDAAKLLAGQAHERAGNLEKEAAEARRTAEELRTANIESNRALEKERLDRLEMEASLADRVFDKQDIAAQSLSRFSGTVASVEYLDDRECRNTAQQINLVLSGAKWITFGGSVTGQLFDGVVVSIGGKGLTGPLQPTPEAVRELMQTSAQSRLIAEALVATLNNSGITARTHAGDGRFPPNELVIRVGAKPNRWMSTLPLAEHSLTMRGNTASFSRPLRQ
jgi:hypothetical protein